MQQTTTPTLEAQQLIRRIGPCPWWPQRCTNKCRDLVTFIAPGFGSSQGFRVMGLLGLRPGLLWCVRYELGCSVVRYPYLFLYMYIYIYILHLAPDFLKPLTERHCKRALGLLRMLRTPNPNMCWRLLSAKHPLASKTWVVVKIMVPFWVPIIIRHLLFRVPKRGP